MPDAAANTPAPALVPEAALERILEALWRCRKYLSAEASRKLDELWNVETFIAFGVLAAIWTGFQFTPIGWIADTALAIYGTYEIGKTLGGFLAACYQASKATTDHELELAAQGIAATMTDVVVDAIAAIIGAAIFGRLRSLIRTVRGRLLPKTSRFQESEAARLKPESPRPKVVDLAVGAGMGVGITHGAVALGQSNYLMWAAALALVAGLGLVLVGVTSTRSSARRAYAAA